MKTYISGKISGLDFEEVKLKFEQAEELLQSVGLEPVNPLKNGLDRGSSWENHMVRDIEILLTCGAVFMLEDWIDSRGARIEKVVAEEAGKILLFESEVVYTNKRIEKIKSAIQEATGLRFEQYTAPGRERKNFFARMIFINMCLTKERMVPEKIANIVKRDRTTVMHCVKIFQGEVDYNVTFREMLNSVEKILSKHVSL